MAADSLAAYPDHNQIFGIYTDASDYQLCACIIQNGRTVAYFTKKLSKSQINYKTMEKELLSMVATLKDFRSMLLRAEIHVHTDHKNLTFDNLSTQRFLRWRYYVEEYWPKLHYVEGPKNILADNLSRLHCLPTPTELSTAPSRVPVSDESEPDEFDGYFIDDKIEAFHNAVDYSGVSDPLIDKLLECYLNLSEINVLEENLLNFQSLAEKKQEDDYLILLQNFHTLS